MALVGNCWYRSLLIKFFILHFRTIGHISWQVVHHITDQNSNTQKKKTSENEKRAQVDIYWDIYL